jgi:hypothetical protein
MMPRGRRPDRALTRSDLPDGFTPDTVRGLDLFTIRRLSQHGNGVLTADEQRRFDDAIGSVMLDTTERLDQSLRRARRGGPGGLDPELRRSFDRTEARLANQARRARRSFPQFTAGWETPPGLTESTRPEGDGTEDDGSERDGSEREGSAGEDAISLGELESEIEQTTDTLEILERIASIQEQQLEHQRSQVLRDVRGVFFALLVSVAVIVAGVSPLVQAQPHERWLIVLWTLVVCGVAGVGYAFVRAAQSRTGEQDD